MNKYIKITAEESERGGVRMKMKEEKSPAVLKQLYIVLKIEERSRMCFFFQSKQASKKMNVRHA